MAALNHAATGGDRSSAYGLQGWRDSAHTVGKNKAHSFFHAERPTGNAPVSQSFGDPLVRTLIFLPQAKLGISPARTARDLLFGAIFFKRRTNVKRGAFDRQNHGKQPLAHEPMNIGE